MWQVEHILSIPPLRQNRIKLPLFTRYISFLLAQKHPNTPYLIAGGLCEEREVVQGFHGPISWYSAGVDEWMDSRRAMCHAAAMWSAVMPDHARDSRLSHICWRDHTNTHTRTPPTENTNQPAYLSSRHIINTRGRHLFSACQTEVMNPQKTEQLLTRPPWLAAWTQFRRHLLFGHPQPFSEASCDFIAMPTGCEEGRRLTATSAEWRTWCPGTGKLEGTGSKWWPIEKSEGIC